MAWVAGFVVLFVPAGMGIREIALAAFLVYIMNVAVGPATLVAVMTRVVLAAAELGWIICGLILKQSRLGANSLERRSPL
jgi:hypothetical protein